MQLRVRWRSREFRYQQKAVYGGRTCEKVGFERGVEKRNVMDGRSDGAERELTCVKWGKCEGDWRNEADSRDGMMQNKMSD